MKSYISFLLCAGLLVAMPALHANDEKKSWVERAADISFKTTDVVGSPTFLILGLSAAHFMGYAINMPQVADVFGKVTLARGLAEIIRRANGAPENEDRFRGLNSAFLASGIMRLTAAFSAQSCAKELAIGLLQCCNYCPMV